MKTVTLISEALGRQFSPYLQAFVVPQGARTQNGPTDLLVRLDPLLVDPNKKTSGFELGSQVISLN
jgi:hypothetical protein